MDNEKLKQANEKSAEIDRLARKTRMFIKISSKTANRYPSYYGRDGDQVTIPKELESVFNALLGDYYRRELEKAKKEFEEM